MPTSETDSQLLIAIRRIVVFQNADDPIHNLTIENLLPVCRHAICGRDASGTAQMRVTRFGRTLLPMSPGIVCSPRHFERVTDELNGGLLANPTICPWT